MEMHKVKYCLLYINTCFLFLMNKDYYALLQFQLEVTSSRSIECSRNAVS